MTVKVTHRNLTDFSAEEIFDLPIADAFAPTDEVEPASPSSADTFGSWNELIADVGTGKRLICLVVQPTYQSSITFEIEVGEGAGSSEAAIARHVGLGASTHRPTLCMFFWKSLTDNARLSVRVRDGNGSANGYSVCPVIM